jgi:hypothetical protein
MIEIKDDVMKHALEHEKFVLSFIQSTCGTWAVPLEHNQCLHSAERRHHLALNFRYCNGCPGLNQTVLSVPSILRSCRRQIASQGSTFTFTVFPMQIYVKVQLANIPP